MIYGCKHKSSYKSWFCKQDQPQTKRSFVRAYTNQRFVLPFVSTFSWSCLQLQSEALFTCPVLANRGKVLILLARSAYFALAKQVRALFTNRRFVLGKICTCTYVKVLINKLIVLLNTIDIGKFEPTTFVLQNEILLKTNVFINILNLNK